MINNSLISESNSIFDVLNKEYNDFEREGSSALAREKTQKDHDFPSKHGFNLTFEDCDLINPFKNMRNPGEQA